MTPNNLLQKLKIHLAIVEIDGRKIFLTILLRSTALSCLPSPCSQERLFAQDDADILGIVLPSLDQLSEQLGPFSSQITRLAGIFLDIEEAPIS